MKKKKQRQWRQNNKSLENPCLIGKKKCKIARTMSAGRVRTQHSGMKKKTTVHNSKTINQLKKPTQHSWSLESPCRTPLCCCARVSPSKRSPGRWTSPSEVCWGCGDPWFSWAAWRREWSPPCGSCWWCSAAPDSACSVCAQPAPCSEGLGDLKASRIGIYFQL